MFLIKNYKILINNYFKPLFISIYFALAGLLPLLTLIFIEFYPMLLMALLRSFLISKI